jgi:hypothetical protein
MPVGSEKDSLKGLQVIFELLVEALPTTVFLHPFGSV